MRELVDRNASSEGMITLRSDSVTVVIMLRGARVLGVDLGSGNLLWVNPNIGQVIGSGGWNTGGIRTWISPERNFFYDDPFKFQGWRCPAKIDPADYRVLSAQKRKVTLISAIRARDEIWNQDLNGTITKSIEILSAAENGIRQSARIALREILTTHNFTRPVALWTLVQVPPGDNGKGTVNIPTVKQVNPLHYFDPIPDTHLRISKDHVEFMIDGRKELKLGIRPEDLPNPTEATLSYHTRRNMRKTAISIFSKTGATSQNECVDPAKSDPDGMRAVIQSYNSDLSKSGLQFGELEIQGAAARTRARGELKTEQETAIDFSVENRRQ